MPSRAFHHAGISYRKLQEMEVAVAQDIMDEVRCADFACTERFKGRARLLAGASRPKER